jgi:hypothetical protein
MPDQIIIYEGTLRAEQEKSYVYLPFDMPTNAVRLHVAYTYSDKIGTDLGLAGGNTIDLGVVDARGIDFLTTGFRGWSGSERSSFSITETEATPGYLAGALIPGEWHVLLGLYKIHPAGCSYRVAITITVNATDDRQPRSAISVQPLPVGDLPSSVPRAPYAPWVRGELHCHSWHSDGDRDASAVVRLAHQRGLDFLAITDHNTTASQRELENLHDPGLILIRGVEATTYKGHFNIWGIPDWVDFRVQCREAMQAAIQFANDRGAVTACGHPEPLGPPWDYESVTNYCCIEVWNGPWTLRNQIALDFWVRQLESGRRIPAIGGSDWHRQREMENKPPRALGTPTVWVYVPGSPNASAILDAIRLGHIILSDEPDGAFVDLRSGENFSAMSGDQLPRPTNGRLTIQIHCQRGAGCQLQLLDQKSALFRQDLADADATTTTELIVSESWYVRAELRATDESLKAMTNPLYLQ